MKNILLLIGLLLFCNISSAASVDWSITGGTANNNGQTIYLLTTLATSYESADKLIASAVGNGTIEKKGIITNFLQHLLRI